MNSMEAQKNCQGFSLIELIVTLAIMAIVLGVGVPSFQDAMLNGKISSARSGLVGDLNFARIEAVKSRTRIMVCARDTATSCGSDWSNGWIVYEDNARPGNAFDLDPSENVLRIQTASIASDKQIDIESSIRSQSAFSVTVPNQFAFESRGRSGVTGLLTFCDSRGVDDARTIVVTATGGIRTDLELNGAGDRIDPWGGALQCP